MINNLYYNSDDAPSWGLEIDDDLLASALASIYNRDYNPRKEIDPDLFRGVVDRLDEAITEGIADDEPDTAFVDALRHSAEVFAAFKVHKAQNDMAARLLDSNGRLKSFEQWSNDVQSIASHQFGPWLRTEYDTAVIRAHQAAEWQRFERDKDVLPNLRWVPSTSPNPGADHRIYWGTILPVDHPFWSRHRPGDRWNCQCSLESTDEPATGIKREDAVDPRKDGPHKGLGDNPGKSGSLFGQDHPYYPDSCSSCPFAGGLKNRLGMMFNNKGGDCNSCNNIQRLIDVARPDATDENYLIIPTENGRVRMHVRQDPHEARENVRTATYFAEKHGEEIDLLPKVEGKTSADALNRTRGIIQEYKSNYTNSQNSIDTILRKAAKQAPYVVLSINSDISLEFLTGGITDRVQRADIEEIILIRDGKDAKYSRDMILSKGFNVKWEDFK
ncbi:hypothetical protein EEL50_09010 [Muribaculaceae bacterium Isolate-105 (HZI)]|nr:hypothetical protein EEL50_09010 [Muribaculaceae bacterium Isolate-105 (HZI)]